MPGWWAPRGLLPHLVAPAAAAALGAVVVTRVRGRAAGWVAAAVAGFAAAWLAGAPAARGEFWRGVLFTVLAAAWALRLAGRTAVQAAVSGGVLLLGGAVAGVASPWLGVAAVVFGAASGVAVLRPGSVLGTVAPATGIVATALGTGGAVRGRVGAMDLVCLGAVLAPVLARALSRRMGRWAGPAAVACVVGAAWAGARVLR